MSAHVSHDMSAGDDARLLQVCAGRGRRTGGRRPAAW